MTVRRVFHLTGVVGDCDGATAALVHLVGASVLHRVTDVTNGVEMHRALIGIGDSVLELLEPIGPSPFQGFLDRFGGGLSAVGVEVDDLAATRAHLAARSVDVAVDLGPDMFATRPAQLAGLAFQWSARGVPEDPRDAASPRPVAVGTVVPARRLAATVAVVDDPATAGPLLADLLGTRSGPLGPAGAPDVAVGLGDCTLALTPTGAGPWGRAQDRARVLALALEVEDVDAAVAALGGEGLAVVGTHVLGPVVDGAALPFPVILAAGLPPGDPRA